MTSTLSELRARGIIEESLEALLNAGGAVIYVGFDPTADSLHVGHMLPILLLARLQRRGHTPIVLVGGATGMIGDPSGRSAERQLLTPEMIAANLAAIRPQLSRFVSFECPNAAIVVDNGDWTRPIGYLEWLRTVGKHFTVNYMAAKESVRRRLEDREQGISYTEFSYMLIQANDFLHLFDHYHCTIQAGGSDQWGNITAGIDLVRKARGAEVFAMTLPLLTTAGGEKFGKSAGNAIWLDPARTTPYQFYQFWMQTDDRDVERYLKIFTFENLETIAELMEFHAEHPERRTAQKLLAAHMTAMVHGQDALADAVRASVALFNKQELSGLSDDELASVFRDVPSITLDRSVLAAGPRLSQILVQSGACASRGEANRLIQGGGVYLNNTRMDADRALSEADLASKSTLVLRTGKKSYYLVRFF
jgi:tyrosyl-tRNA synthetase